MSVSAFANASELRKTAARQPSADDQHTYSESYGYDRG